MKKYGIFWSFGWMYLIVMPAFAQSILDPVAAAYPVTGNWNKPGCAVWTAMLNPALIVREQQTKIGLYTERRFLLQELAQYRLALMVPGASDGWGLEFIRGGFQASYEQRLRGMYSYRLGKQLTTGIAFDFWQLSQTGQKSSRVISGALGFLYQLSEDWSFACLLANPVRSGTGALALNNRWTGRAGIAFQASDQTGIQAEIFHEQFSGTTWQCSLEYDPVPFLFFRSGIRGSTGLYWAEAGFVKPGYALGLTGSYHPVLGWSPGFNLVFNWKTKKNYPIDE